MSTTKKGPSSGARPAVAPKNEYLASSSPGSSSGRMPRARSAASKKAALFFASRAALVAAARVDLAPGERARLHLRLAADLTSFTGRELVRIVEPGAVELWVGASSADIRATCELELVGPVRQVGPERVLVPDVRIERA